MGAHIGAIIVEKLVLDSEDAALRIDGGADVVALFARMIGGDQMLAPVLDPFDRSPKRQGRRADENIFGIDFAANTEPPPTWPSYS